MIPTKMPLIALLLMVAFGFSNMTIAAAAGKDSSSLLGEASAAEKKQINILYIGNSFTQRNFLTRVIRDLAQAADQNCHLRAQEVIIGGETLQIHWKFESQNWIKIASLSIEEQNKTIELQAIADNQRNDSDSPQVSQRKFNEQELLKELKKKQPNWDYVVLQSWRDTDGGVESPYAVYTRKFAALIKAQGGRVILYETAPETQNAKPLTAVPDPAVAQANARFLAELAKELDALVVPMSLVVNHCQRVRPDLTLRYVNDFHPNTTMTLLTASAFYAVLFDKTPEGLPVKTIKYSKTVNKEHPELDPDGGLRAVDFSDELRLSLQKIAWEGVQQYHEIARHSEDVEKKLLILVPGLFDQSQPDTLGLHKALGTETITVFAPTDDTGKFSLGVQLIPFKGHLYVSWYSAPLHEPNVGREKGAWTAYSRSPDGVNWSKPMVLFPGLEGDGWRAQGSFWTDGKTLVAYCQELNSFSGGGWQRNLYMTSTDGIHWSEPKLLKDVNGKVIQQNIMENPRPLPNDRLIAPFQGNLYREDIGKVQHVATAYYTDDPLGISDWTRAKMPLLPSDGGNSRELEHSWFIRADGKLTMLFRDSGGSQCVLASTSEDRGKTWSRAVLTDMPDSGSMQSAGNLPDGTVYNINIPRAARSRTPLVVSLSRDGQVFDKAYLLRTEKDMQPRRYEGRAKGPGYSYPSSVVRKDYLYVGYTTNKEDVDITRVPLKSLQYSADTTMSGKEINTDAADSEKEVSVIVDWALPWPDFSKPLAGFPLLKGVEHFRIFTASPEMGTFNHGPGLYHYNGVFYALWNNHLRDEDRTGQRVLGSISRDGRHWSEAFEVFPHPEPPLPHPEIGYEGRHLTQQEMFRVGDKVYAQATVRNLKGKGTTGSSWNDQRQTLGVIAREIRSDGRLGDVFLHLGLPIEAVAPSYPSYIPLPKPLSGIPLGEKRYSANMPSGIIKGVDGHVLCEHTLYQRPDGTYVTLSRDLGPKGDQWSSSWCLYAAESKDGRDWTPFYRSNIPNPGTMSRAGNLPDGTVFLIGTRVPSIRDDDGTTDRHVSLLRDPLIISLSKDGRVFDRAAVIRSELMDATSWKFKELKTLIKGHPYPRYPGRAKDVGIAYPSVIIVDDALYVLYSINKEDIEISRIPLSAISSLRKAEPEFELRRGFKVVDLLEDLNITFLSKAI